MEILRRVDPAGNGGVLLAGVVLDQMHLNYLGRSTNLLHDPPRRVCPAARRSGRLHGRRRSQPAYRGSAAAPTHGTSPSPATGSTRSGGLGPRSHPDLTQTAPPPAAFLHVVRGWCVVRPEPEPGQVREVALRRGPKVHSTPTRRPRTASVPSPLPPSRAPGAPEPGQHCPGPPGRGHPPQAPPRSPSGTSTIGARSLR